MHDAVQEFKTRAEILHRRILSKDPQAVSRLRALPGNNRRPLEKLTDAASSVSRRDCLTLVAREHGFENWPEAKNVLEGDASAGNFGDLLYRKGVGGPNPWFSSYEEARAIRSETQGYLLAWRRQFLVVDRYFIENLGLDPRDADWEAIGFDWVKPLSVQARSRLYAKLVATLPKEVD